MSDTADVRPVGVEEELLLVDAQTGRVVPRAADVLPHGAFDAELMREQVEVQTKPVQSLAELRDELVRNRRLVAEAAAASGLAVAALGTSPLPGHPSTSGAARFLEMRTLYGLTAREQLTCGCHVHVQVDSREEGVAVIDRIRPWLAVFMAVAANSPFWQGEDTGYASYRGRVWGRWPSSGPTELFGSVETYEATVDALVASRVLMDKKMVYFDARLSEANPTVELRVADVCRSVDMPVLLAALGRGLVETAVASWRAGEPPPPVRVELLRVASWRAARSGIGGQLLRPWLDGTPAPAGEVLRSLIEHVRPALARNGDVELVERLVERLLVQGSGATQQRACHAATQDLAEVVRDAVRATAEA